MIVQFVAPLLDHSGYGEASRNTLLAMIQSGIQVTTKIASFTPDILDVGKAGSMAKRLEKKYPNYDVNLIELTPEHYPIFYEKGKYNIGYFFWEVVGVDQKWVSWCNLMDEIWLPSPLFAEMFKKAGVKKPIKTVPCAMDMSIGKKLKPWKMVDTKRPKLLFYSIFQWTERKNPRALLQAYWQAFQGNNDVGLIIKTYRSNFSESERKAIKEEINKWKQELGQGDYPKVWLICEDFTYNEIMRLHKTGDVFVSAHRGEGWGYSQMAAMAFGNLLISTDFGGIHEYLNDDLALLPDYKFVNVSGMGHIPWYNHNQQWAEIDQKALQKMLKQAYTQRKLVQSMALSGKQFVCQRFNYLTVGMEIKKILESDTRNAKVRR